MDILGTGFPVPAADIPDTIEEGAQAALLALMCGISEECWCAGWMSGLGADLMRIAGAGKAAEYGQCLLTQRQARLLNDLALEAGGWWAWDSEAGRPVFKAIA